MRTPAAIRRFIVGEFLPDTPEDELPPDLDLIEHGIIDSLGVLRLVAAIENELGVTVEPEEFDHERFRSIDAIHGFVRAKLEGPAAVAA
jgi:acyl carrier protein